MINFKNELEKAHKYNNLDNQNISVYMYQTFGIILLNLLFYKYVIGHFFPTISKDFLSLSVIISCMLFCFHIQRKFKKIDKAQKSIIFENVNLFEFLKAYFHKNSLNLVDKNDENMELYVSQLYLAITGIIMKEKIMTEKQEDLNAFYKNVENKTVQMKSYSILRYINSFKK